MHEHDHIHLGSRLSFNVVHTFVHQILVPQGIAQMFLVVRRPNDDFECRS